MDVGERACELECVQGTNKHEFVGPVKIILLDPPPGEYRRRKWGSAGLSGVMFIMGATIFLVLAFTLKFTLKLGINLHIVLCTIGLQLFVPAGILMHNRLFGAAAQLTLMDRKCQHVCLEFFGLITAAGGAAVMALLEFESLKPTVHSITGAISLVLMVFNLLIGPTVFCTNPAKAYGQFNRQAHILFGLPAYISATACFISGLLKESFTSWAVVKHFHYILIALTVVYSLIVFASVRFRSRSPQ